MWFTRVSIANPVFATMVMAASTTTATVMTTAATVTKTRIAATAATAVGEHAPNKEVGLGSESPIKDRRVRFAVDEEVHAEPPAEPTKQDQRAPIKMVSRRMWSPGIYQALRLLGKGLDVAWERAFIHRLTFN